MQRWILDTAIVRASFSVLGNRYGRGLLRLISRVLRTIKYS